MGNSPSPGGPPARLVGSQLVGTVSRFAVPEKALLALEPLLALQNAVGGAAGSMGRSSDAILRILAAVRERLGMDIAFIAEHVDDTSIVRFIDTGDPATARPGELISLVPMGGDGRENAVVVHEADIGVYVRLPIRFSDGELYGSLCGLSRTAGDPIGERDLNFLELLSQLVAETLESGHLRRKELATSRQMIMAIIDRGGMTMAFQPIVDMSTLDVVGLEALARIETDPPVPPNEWFDRAAAVGLDVELELIAVRLALSNLWALPAGMFLSVNLSPNVIVAPGFSAAMEAVRLDRVVIELTEHARVRDYEAIDAVLGPLRRRGLRLAIDDAGAGFSNMLHILKLQPDVIKLDINLTRDVDTDRVRRALAGSLVAFAIQTDATIVAEGIETEGEFGALRSLGVTWGQGYLLGRPGTLEADERANVPQAATSSEPAPESAPAH
ncbi:MAG: hypothetical protein QOD83_4947 [Solirubrobacteraceae bacterium]|nr:hypothetical protein [Solirubrobacteraceae bacterium]